MLNRQVVKIIAKLGWLGVFLARLVSWAVNPMTGRWPCAWKSHASARGKPAGGGVNEGEAGYNSVF